MTGERLIVDPVACTAHGMCAELFPEWIELDDWGYPIITARDVPPELREHAERAVKSCPALALKLRRGPRPTRQEPARPQPVRAARVP